MNEHEPQAEPWKIAEIAKVLRVDPQGAEDIVLGYGTRFRLNSPADTTSLELYSGAGVARIMTPDVHLMVRNLEPPAVENDRVVLTSGAGRDAHYRMAVTASGEVTMSRMPPPRPEAESMTETPGEISAAESVSVEPASRSDGSTAPEKRQDRVTLTGRVGAAPSFRTTAAGVLIARFPVAVHLDNDKTRWETVVAFGAKAERVREAVQKGQTVEVIGYPHERQVPRRDGTTKNVNEVYAAVIKPR